MGLFQTAEKWLFSVAVKRVGAGLVGVAVGWLTSGPAQTILAKAGVVVDPDKTTEYLMGVFVAGVVAAHDYLRMTTFGKNLKL